MDISELLQKRKEKVNELNELKLRIIEVEKPIREKLFNLFALGEEYNFLKKITPTKTILTDDNVYDDVIFKTKFQLNYKEVCDLRENIMREIENLQSEIEAFNNSTELT